VIGELYAPPALTIRTAMNSRSGMCDGPLIVMSSKAKSAGWSGVHNQHTKIADAAADERRHARSKEQKRSWPPREA